MSVRTTSQGQAIKPFNKAPLPFMGQKRNFLKYFKEAIKNYPPNATYVDLFGGSGLLSHTIKNFYPEAKVVYNDFDNFKERLANIPRTNKILAALRIILKDHPKDKKIDGVKKMKVLQLLESQTGFVDYITLSSSLLFAMKTALTLGEFKKCTLYNCVRKSDYFADGYLDNIEVVTKDYKEIFKEYQNNDNVVFLVDPPYLSTDVGTYKMYWRLADYLDVLDVLKDKPYFYFTSNKSSILELCEWVETKTGGENPFKDANKMEMHARASHDAGYTDIMLYRGWTSTITL